MAGDSQSDRGTALGIDELVRAAKQSAPALAALGDEDAERLLREAFKQIRRQVDSLDEGRVRVAGLGLFRVRQRKREKEGKAESVRRISFRPAARA